MEWMRFPDFALRVGCAMPGALWRRPGELIAQFDRVFLAGLPIVLAAGVCVGLVTWLQTRGQLSSYGLEANLPGILAAAVVLETGPTLAGLVLAGRMGAGMAAEVGSMALTEELAARETLGAPMESSVVAPRVWACLLAAPLLTVLMDGAAIAGAMCAESAFGRMPLEGFARRTLDYLRSWDATLATLKTVVFGGLTGLFGCWNGARVADRPSSEAVGAAATRGVVAAMLAVLGSNILMLPHIQWLASALNRGPG